MLPIRVLKKTEGKILTILEASLEGQKLEATKSLIRQEIGELYSYADYDDSQFETTGNGTTHIDSFTTHDGNGTHG